MSLNLFMRCIEAIYKEFEEMDKFETALSNFADEKVCFFRTKLAQFMLDMLDELFPNDYLIVSTLFWDKNWFENSANSVQPTVEMPDGTLIDTWARAYKYLTKTTEKKEV